jgi:hypothetical protein
MGEKEWVVAGQRWTENMALNFFCGGSQGAISAYKKVARRDYYAKHGVLMPAEEEAILTQSLGPLLAGPDDAINGEKVRFLDVGSCYNPHLSQERFDVTALDLKPTHSSVHQSDFLQLKVLPEASTALIRRDELGNTHLDGLPENHFHAISLSLVLNYLPSPRQRLDMLKKARRLLLCPPALVQCDNNKMHTQTHTHKPHESGLLLILEKESVLGASVCLYMCVCVCLSHSTNILLSTSPPPSAGNGKKAERAQLLLRHWKAAIAEIGFELVTYQNLSAGSRRSHAFAFRAVPMPLSPDTCNTTKSDTNTTTASTPGRVLTGAPEGLYCKHDLEALYLSRGDKTMGIKAQVQGKAKAKVKGKVGATASSAKRDHTQVANAAGDQSNGSSGGAAPIPEEENEKKKRK